MNIIVTGASGFIGKALLEEFKDGLIWAISRNRPTRPLGDNVSWSQADLGEQIVPEGASSELWDAMIHAAGTAHVKADEHTKGLFLKGNVQSTISALKLAIEAKVPHFVLISSVSAELDPSGIYGASKLQAEKIALDVCKQSGIRCTVIRPVMVYGESDTKGNLMKLIDQIRKGFVPLPGGGETVKPMIYIHNLTWIIRQIIATPDAVPVSLNVRDPDVWTVNKLCRALAEMLGRKIWLIKIPRWGEKMLLSGLGLANRLRLIKRINADSYRKLSTSTIVPLDPWLERRLEDLPYASDAALRRTVNGYLGARK